MIPRSGDRGYPTVQGVALVVALAASLTMGLYLWLGRWWPFLVFSLFVAYYLAANLWTVRHTRRFVGTTAFTSSGASGSVIPSGLFEGGISPFHREQFNWILMTTRGLDDRYEDFFHMGYSWTRDQGGRRVPLNAEQLRLVRSTAPYYSGRQPIPQELLTPGISAEQEPLWFLAGGFRESNLAADESASAATHAAARRIFDAEKAAAFASVGASLDESRAFEMFALGACFVEFERALVAELQSGDAAT